ncbi:hypothetical protein Dxin01_04076 [Deinococcus xinjiangensis]|uniref:Replication-relaxation n=1 Tax=Deinococcus xinjiangensis TaxID=457454 RepID=A0ABP9VI36_9DEIO
MHSNRQKRLVRALLADGEVATTAQLERLGILRGAELLNLPTRTLSMNTNGKGSLRSLTFVALKSETLDRPTRDLGHQAARFELRRYRRDMDWADVRRTNHTGGAKHAFPDWLLFDGVSGRFLFSVEVDVGYPRETIRKKLIGADEEWGTPGYLYATTIHSRVAWFRDVVAELHAKGLVPHLKRAEGVYVNFWAVGDPYTGRPYCQKLNRSRWKISQGESPESQ